LTSPSAEGAEIERRQGEDLQGEVKAPLSQPAVAPR